MLLHLPLDIVENICRQLLAEEGGLQSVLLLRLTCSDMYRKVNSCSLFFSHAFVATHFHVQRQLKLEVLTNYLDTLEANTNWRIGTLLINNNMLKQFVLREDPFDRMVVEILSRYKTLFGQSVSQLHLHYQVDSSVCFRDLLLELYSLVCHPFTQIKLEVFFWRLGRHTEVPVSKAFAEIPISFLSITKSTHPYSVENFMSHFTRTKNLKIICSEAKTDAYDLDKVALLPEVESLTMNRIEFDQSLISATFRNITTLQVDDWHWNQGYLSDFFKKRFPNLKYLRFHRPVVNNSTDAQTLPLIIPQSCPTIQINASLFMICTPIRNLREAHLIYDCTVNENIKHFFKATPMSLKILNIVFVDRKQEKVDVKKIWSLAETIIAHNNFLKVLSFHSEIDLTSRHLISKKAFPPSPSLLFLRFFNRIIISNLPKDMELDRRVRILDSRYGWNIVG